MADRVDVYFRQRLTEAELTTVLLQMALGAEPRLVRAQAELAFTALTQAARH
jgi:hypothetical protein